MPINPDLPLEAVTVDLTHLRSEDIQGRANCKLFQFRIDIRAQFRRDLSQLATCNYTQQVRTKFTKKRFGHVIEQTDTGIHDDNYIADDGVWNDNMLWINDEPGIVVAKAETLEYEFFHKQTFWHTVTKAILFATVGHTVYMRGTYPHIIITPQAGRVFNWQRPTVPEVIDPSAFGADLDF